MMWWENLKTTYVMSKDKDVFMSVPSLEPCLEMDNKCKNSSRLHCMILTYYSIFYNCRLLTN